MERQNVTLSAAGSTFLGAEHYLKWPQIHHQDIAGFTEIGEQSALLPIIFLFFFTSQMRRLCWLFLSVENLLARVPNGSPYPRNKLSRKFHLPGYKSFDHHEQFHVCTWRCKAAQLATTKNLLEVTIRFQGFEQNLPSLALLLPQAGSIQEMWKFSWAQKSESNFLIC